VFFIYSDIQWGTANIGFNAGDGVRLLMVPGALTPQTRNIDNGSNVNISGLYIYRVDQHLVFGPSGKCSRLIGTLTLCCVVLLPASSLPTTTTNSSLPDYLFKQGHSTSSVVWFFHPNVEFELENSCYNHKAYIYSLFFTSQSISCIMVSILYLFRQFGL